MQEVREKSQRLGNIPPAHFIFQGLTSAICTVKTDRGGNFEFAVPASNWYVLAARTASPIAQDKQYGFWLLRVITKKRDVVNIILDGSNSVNSEHEDSMIFASPYMNKAVYQ